MGLSEEDEVEGLEGGFGREFEVFAGVVDGVVDGVGVPGEVWEFGFEVFEEGLLFGGEGDGWEEGLELEFDVVGCEFFEPVAGVVCALAEVGVVGLIDVGGDLVGAVEDAADLVPCGFDLDQGDEVADGDVDGHGGGDLVGL